MWYSLRDKIRGDATMDKVPIKTTNESSFVSKIRRLPSFYKTAGGIITIAAPILWIINMIDSVTTNTGWIWSAAQWLSPNPVGFLVLAVLFLFSIHLGFKQLESNEMDNLNRIKDLIEPIQLEIDAAKELQILTKQYIECEKYLVQQESERAGLIYRLKNTRQEAHSYHDLQIEYSMLSIPNNCSYILQPIGLSKGEAPSPPSENDKSSIDMKDYEEFGAEAWIMELEIIYQKYKKVVEERKANLESKLKI